MIIDAYKRFNPNPARPRISFDTGRARAIAGLYDKAPQLLTTAVRAAWYRLAGELADQYHALQAAGIRFRFEDTDPYHTSAELFADAATGTIRVFRTPADHGHPLWTRTENDTFRAVHDAFGHCLYGFSFGRIGEECAYQVHAASLTPIAACALACETRFQNAWFEFGPHSQRVRSQRPYPPQKCVILPPWCYAR